MCRPGPDWAESSRHRRVGRHDGDVAAVVLEREIYSMGEDARLLVCSR
ncbi:hypothetical protein [Parafrankia sp. EUN1f]|nr:hypothetical protein [Parafrankia sp. EUN1f]